MTSRAARAATCPRNTIPTRTRCTRPSPSPPRTAVTCCIPSPDHPQRPDGSAQGGGAGVIQVVHMDDAAPELSDLVRRRFSIAAPRTRTIVQQMRPLRADALASPSRAAPARPMVLSPQAQVSVPAPRTLPAAWPRLLHPLCLRPRALRQQLPAPNSSAPTRAEPEPEAPWCG
ncbi:hypothetical protein B0H13DRAFT_2120789 [Mycena leptocephala]|nr:hypothetical protein B0H13DRAFT_2120789 [Mycena leptocephala]